MNIAKIKYTDVANGFGIRVSLFVSGCRNHCKGCFNPETWNFDYGEPYSLYHECSILDALKQPWIKGLSILGGDPLEFENRIVLENLLRKAKEMYPNKDVWLYTGYLYENVKTYKILNYVDVLVDGKFILELKNPKLAFKGSENQRIINLHTGEVIG